MIAHHDGEDFTLLFTRAGTQNQTLRPADAADQSPGEDGSRGFGRLGSDNVVDIFPQRVRRSNSEQALRSGVEKSEVSFEIVREGGIVYVSENLQ